MIKDKHNLKTWLFFSIGSLLFIAVIFLIYHLFFSSVKLDADIACVLFFL